MLCKKICIVGIVHVSFFLVIWKKLVVGFAKKYKFSAKLKMKLQLPLALENGHQTTYLPIRKIN